ncbi:hypothetical protein L9G16_20070, partial [Shewanella sp. A25]|nr:hypothetical protein [Shewanella shenzhenensis]
PEQAAERFDAGAFDLIAFGRGLLGPVSERLKREFAHRNPKVRFLDTYAPLAVRQIVAALAGTDGTPPVDLAAYCERIGYNGPRTPTIETLRA